MTAAMRTRPRYVSSVLLTQGGTHHERLNRTLYSQHALSRSGSVWAITGNQARPFPTPWLPALPALYKHIYGARVCRRGKVCPTLSCARGTRSSNDSRACSPPFVALHLMCSRTRCMRNLGTRRRRPNSAPSSSLRTHNLQRPLVFVVCSLFCTSSSY